MMQASASEMQNVKSERLKQWFFFLVAPLQHEITPHVTGWQVYRGWGESLLGNKVKYRMYQYEIQVVEILLNNYKVSLDEYSE